MVLQLSIVTALVIDLAFGDPRWLPHPVRGIGVLAAFSERIGRACIAQEKLAGIFAFSTTLFLSTAAVATLLFFSGAYSPLLQTILAILVLYFFVAIKDLLAHSRKVFQALDKQKDLTEARSAVGMIVGRDTGNMNEEEICRACVETVAENMVDGITAPLFWATVFSLFSPWLDTSAVVLAAVGITAYKAVNTMDSMFGYKNSRYRHFGWAAARIDDVVNFIPARLSGICIVLGALLLGKDYRNSWKIFRRDRLNHSSPNAAHTEAAIAGALRLQLGGPSRYFGQVVEKPFIGDSGQKIFSYHILDTNRVVLTSSSIFFAFLLILTGI